MDAADQKRNPRIRIYLNKDEAKRFEQARQLAYATEAGYGHDSALWFADECATYRKAQGAAALRDRLARMLANYWGMELEGDWPRRPTRYERRMVRQPLISFKPDELERIDEERNFVNATVAAGQGLERTTFVYLAVVSRTRYDLARGASHPGLDYLLRLSEESDDAGLTDSRTSN